MPPSSRSARSETAVSANRWAQIAVERTGWRPLQCISNQVSGQSLCKTGIFADAAGDFRRLAPQNQGIGGLETKSNARKAGISGPISRFFESLAGRRNAWLGREDSNLRMVESKSTALPLGDAPTAGKQQDRPCGFPFGNAGL
jgi:hypothetical protein